MSNAEGATRTIDAGNHLSMGSLDVHDLRPMHHRPKAIMAANLNYNCFGLTNLVSMHDAAQKRFDMDTRLVCPKQ